jgi:NAD(P)-dependent dehydrogenase (short-subunit alcohol dehydrogenase family)
MNNQKNDFILITGATSTIGSAIATCVSDYSNILIHARDFQKAKKLSKQIDSKNIVKIWLHDFSDFRSIERSLTDFLSSENITISSLVHCAASVKILPIKNFRAEYYEHIFNINLFSSLEILKVILKKKNFSSLKSIVFISAFYSKFGNKGNTIYSSSKGAIDSLVKSLAVEIAPVRVNSVLPGAIETDMTNHLFSDPQFIMDFNRRYILGRGYPSDVANLVDFLISEKSRWITGQSILIDGGASIV